MYKIKKRVNIERSTNDILEKHPVPVLGIDYKVKIIYRNIKVPEVYVEKTVIKISLPNKYRKDNNQYILDLAIDKMYEQIAKVEVERAMEKTADSL